MTVLTAADRDRIREAVDRERRVRLRMVTPEVFLRDALLCGPRPVSDLVAAAREVGVGKRSLRQAARRLGVVGGDGGVWSLASSEAAG